MGKLDCGTNPAGIIVDIIPVLIVCSILEKINEVWINEVWKTFVKEM